MTPAVWTVAPARRTRHYCLCTGREPRRGPVGRSRRSRARASGGRQHGGVSDPGPAALPSRSMARNGWGRLSG